MLKTCKKKESLLSLDNSKAFRHDYLWSSDLFGEIFVVKKKYIKIIYARKRNLYVPLPEFLPAFQVGEQ